MKKPRTETVHPLAGKVGPQMDTVALLHALALEDRRAAEAVQKIERKLAKGVELLVDRLSSGGRLIYLGAGTSGRLASLDAAECPPTFGTPRSMVQAVIAGGPQALVRAVEGAEDDERAAGRALDKLKVGKRDVVCGVTASGRTPFVLAGLSHARELGAKTITVCCSPPHGQAGLVICADTGPELVQGSTRLKAGTATKLMLNALSTGTMVKLGRVEKGRMVAMKPTNTKLKARAVEIVASLRGVSESKAWQLLLLHQGNIRAALAER